MFQGVDILMNFLVTLMIFVFVAILILLVILCRKLLIKCPLFIRNIVMRLERKLYLNAILRASLETYLKVSINFFVQANCLRTYTFEERINLGSLVLTGVFCFAFPYYAWSWLYKAYFEKSLDKVETRQAYDSLYMNIELDKGPQALAFTLAFLVRRLLFAYVIGQFVYNIVFQVMAIDFLSMFLLGYYLSVFPMSNKINNFI